MKNGVGGMVLYKRQQRWEAPSACVVASYVHFINSVA
ncbi:UNVERIFIED_CONTAM: hypothetical protein ABIC26_005225 [Paenibacillus sp. PvR008]